MEESYEKIISRLKKRIEYIISKFEIVNAENKELTSQLQSCKQQLDISNNKIKDLEQRLDKLQLMEAFKTSAGDVKEAKQNIGKIVREIDKCIALLND